MSEQRIFTPDQERAARILKGILEVHAKQIGFKLPVMFEADIIDYYAEEFAEVRKSAAPVPQSGGEARVKVLIEAEILEQANEHGRVRVLCDTDENFFVNVSTVHALAAPTPDRAERVRRNQAQAWANNSAAYQEQHVREGNLQGAEFYRGAREAFQRVVDELFSSTPEKQP